MHQAVPRTIRFHMIVRNWHFRTCITKLAFRKLAVGTFPDVSPAIALHKLSATDSRIVQNMLHDFATVTFEHIAVDSSGHHLAPRTFGMNALHFSMS